MTLLPSPQRWHRNQNSHFFIFKHRFFTQGVSKKSRIMDELATSFRDIADFGCHLKLLPMLLMDIRQSKLDQVESKWNARISNGMGSRGNTLSKIRFLGLLLCVKNLKFMKVGWRPLMPSLVSIILIWLVARLLMPGWGSWRQVKPITTFAKP